MAKTKQEKLEDIREQIAQLEKRQKELIQSQKVQERKDRTRRLCKRAGLLESMLPDTVALTDVQFKIFLEKTVLTGFARKMLESVAAQGSITAESETGETQPNHGESGSENGSNGTRVSV